MFGGSATSPVWTYVLEYVLRYHARSGKCEPGCQHPTSVSRGVVEPCSDGRERLPTMPSTNDLLDEEPDADLTFFHHEFEEYEAPCPFGMSGAFILTDWG